MPRICVAPKKTPTVLGGHTGIWNPWGVLPLMPEAWALSPQIELAILRFPYDSWGTPFQQLKQVVEEPSPQLPAEKFSAEFVDFTSQW